MDNTLDPSKKGPDGLPRPTDTKAPPGDQISLAALVRAPWFVPTVAVTLSLLFAFTFYVKHVTSTWFEPESLYSHGPLVPILSGWILWEKRDRLKEIPVKGSIFGFIALALVLYMTWIASHAWVLTLESLLFMSAIVTAVVAVVGWRWLWATLPAILYLLFGLPVWEIVVDKYTQPLQRLSTDMAYQILGLLGYSPYRGAEPTLIYLSRFELNVAAACSGLKLTLALIALVVFFILTGKAKPFANILLLVVVVPFAVLLNGIRIASIGMVGNAFGHDAGMQYHDYGGYLELLLCFYLLHHFTRILGFRR